MPPTGGRLQIRSKAEAVADVLRDEIWHGTLAPGTTLRQRDVAERYGVSPTPVREALSRLEAEGFLTASLQRGATVVRRSADRIRENFTIRATLEGLAAEMATPKLTAADLERLTALNEEMRHRQRMDARVIELNRTFHMTLYRANDLPLLLNMLGQLWHALEGGPKLGRPLEESVRQHQEILEALGRGDAARAAQLTRAHVLSSTPRLSPEPAD
ncbi:MAG: GntR family transcriptional regulator [Candidatus Dormibacterales bacterium]